MAHPLGTDEFGRDILARLLHGGRISLAIGLVAMLVSVTVGTVLGSLAGYLGGPVDALIMRTTDGMLAIPMFFVLVTALTIFGRSLFYLVVFIGLERWIPVARMVRAEILRTRELKHVLDAETLGAAGRAASCATCCPRRFPRSSWPRRWAWLWRSSKRLASATWGSASGLQLRHGGTC
jgi:peptide/nickel transport system permease protein